MEPLGTGFRVWEGVGSAQPPLYSFSPGSMSTADSS